MSTLRLEPATTRTNYQQPITSFPHHDLSMYRKFKKRSRKGLKSAGSFLTYSLVGRRSEKLTLAEDLFSNNLQAKVVSMGKNAGCTRDISFSKIGPTLSIIIPTLNEEGFIDQLLEDIISQDASYEIIVTDSGSFDQTEEIVRNFARRHPNKIIRFLRARKKGVSIARNTGANNAKGEYILFLDADTRIPPEFLKNTIQEMKERNLDAAGCYLLPNSERLVDKTFFYLHQHLILKPLQYTKRPGAAGAGIIVKKTTHDQIYGFDEKFKCNEDLEYVKKISETCQFRMLKSTNIVYSMRRFDEEGRPLVWFKYAVSGLCYLLDLKYVKFQYEFGKFSKNNHK